ncbi:MAG: ThuA domain-containing protein [Armatimonadetes bacterium]|nr:ThuA domain-containing protein [Armatimonadota bacterium]
MNTLIAIAALGAILSTIDAASQKKRILVVTHTTGFRHADSIKVGEPIVKQIGAGDGDFEVEYCRDGEDVKTMLTPEGLKRFDGVFFLNTTGDLGIPDLNAFLAWIKSGKAFIGVHSATDTYHNRKEFIEMIGGEFKTHGKQCTVEMKVEQPNHPAVRHLGQSWTLFDEIYIMTENNRKNVTVLLSLDNYPDDGSPQANQPGDHLLAWTRAYGSGRVFYTALGHRPDVWEKPEYQRHLIGGIRWALGLDEAR